MPQHTAEEAAKNALGTRSIADDPFEQAMALAARNQGQAPAPPQDPIPGEGGEDPGFLSGIMDALGGLFGGGEEEAPAAPPPSTALSVALEKMRLGLPLTPEEQAAMEAAGGQGGGLGGAGGGLGGPAGPTGPVGP